jgi:L-lactate dehydrogenase complex protein LldE
VALCVTCIVDQLMPEVGVASVRILRRAGCEVDFPAEQTCCGQPFFNSGFRRQAADLARRTIEIFETYDAVVVPSGSCTTMIRVEYPHLLADSPEWKERAQRLAEMTYELSEYLVHQVGWDPTHQTSEVSETSEVSDEAQQPATSHQPPATSHQPTAVTYHDSCHMRRLLHLKDEPRDLLNGAGCSLHEMEESERCCGFGGLFSLRMPEVSGAMTAEKLSQAAASEANTLVTADPGCLMQMRGLAGDDGPLLKHLAVVLEEMTR